MARKSGGGQPALPRRATMPAAAANRIADHGEIEDRARLARRARSAAPARARRTDEERRERHEEERHAAGHEATEQRQRDGGEGRHGVASKAEPRRAGPSRHTAPSPPTGAGPPRRPPPRTAIPASRPPPRPPRRAREPIAAAGRSGAGTAAAGRSLIRRAIIGERQQRVGVAGDGHCRRSATLAAPSSRRSRAGPAPRCGARRWPASAARRPAPPRGASASSRSRRGLPFISSSVPVRAAASKTRGQSRGIGSRRLTMRPVGCAITSTCGFSIAASVRAVSCSDGCVARYGPMRPPGRRRRAAHRGSPGCRRRGSPSRCRAGCGTAPARH